MILWFVPSCAPLVHAVAIAPGEMNKGAQGKGRDRLLLVTATNPFPVHARKRSPFLLWRIK